MQTAAERRTVLLPLIASAILALLPVCPSSAYVLASRNRAELSAENGQFSVEPSTLTPTNASSYYDWPRELASESLVAPKGVTRPAVSDPKLKNIINDLYKGDKTPNPIGTGSTADAIRHEMRTGQQVGGRWYTQKGQDYSRALEKWLKNNPNAPAAERTAAQQVLDDLGAALGGN